MPGPVADRLSAKGPKRMLALDGGGTRGIVSIAFLEAIERTLQKKLQRGDDFVLSDYFDLIGGTSVGSILATLLALGWRVDQIKAKFEIWAPNIFKPASRFGIIGHLFDARRLRGHIQSVVYDWPLSTDKLKTGLCIVTKRADTGSVWPFVNNPRSRYWEARPAEGDRSARIGNKDYKLLDVIRASTAAPRYFSPSRIGIFHGLHDGESRGLFVDGSVSPHNNPALQLLMLAGLRGYNLGWPLGAQNLLLISVGTGSYPSIVRESRSAALDAVEALKGVVTDSKDLGLTLLQWMSNPRLRWLVDRELGDLNGDRCTHPDILEHQQALFSFQRYDIRLEREWLHQELKETFSDSEIEALRDFTRHAVMSRLHGLGAKAARVQVDVADFPDYFDVVWRPSSVSPVTDSVSSSLSLDPAQRQRDSGVELSR